MPISVAFYLNLNSETPVVSVQIIVPLTKMDSEEESYDDVDSGNESSGDDVDFPMEVEVTGHREKQTDSDDYPYEVLSTEEIVQHMVDSIKDVNSVVEVTIVLWLNVAQILSTITISSIKIQLKSLHQTIWVFLLLDYIINHNYAFRFLLQPHASFSITSDGTKKSLWKGSMMETKNSYLMKPESLTLSKNSTLLLLPGLRYVLETKIEFY